MTFVIADHDAQIPDFVRDTINLAQPRLGAEAIFATDDFFADVNRMLKPEDPVFIDGKYDENGKWMDGWESRRKREEGHDYAIVRLGLTGMIMGVEVDTRHFTGNYAPSVSIEACLLDEGEEPGDKTKWHEILGATPLQGDSRHFAPIPSKEAWSHLRIHIYPDGGIARLRVFGLPHVNWETKIAKAEAGSLVDLAALRNGGRPMDWSDAHFGKPENLLAPGRGVNMGDGWETRRRREPGFDWCIIALGAPGRIEKIEVDTAHFKGNFPHEVSIQAALMHNVTRDALVSRSMYWRTLLPPQKMTMDAIHEFVAEIEDIGPVSHVRLNMHPDGGVSRLRLLGKPGLGE